MWYVIRGTIALQRVERYVRVLRCTVGGRWQIPLLINNNATGAFSFERERGERRLQSLARL